MTETVPLPEPVVPPAVVAPAPDSRLEQLAAQYDVAKAEADKAAQALKAITDGIKIELIAAVPGSNDVRLESNLLAAPLRLSASDRWTVDTKKLKAEDPATYARWARKSTTWSLRVVAS